MCAPTVSLGFFGLVFVHFFFHFLKILFAKFSSNLTFNIYCLLLLSFFLPRYSFPCRTIFFDPLHFSILIAFKILLKGHYHYMSSVILFINSYYILLYEHFQCVFISWLSRKLKLCVHLDPDHNRFVSYENKFPKFLRCLLKSKTSAIAWRKFSLPFNLILAETTHNYVVQRYQLVALENFLQLT